MREVIAGLTDAILDPFLKGVLSEEQREGITGWVVDAIMGPVEFVARAVEWLVGRFENWLRRLGFGPALDWVEALIAQFNADGSADEMVDGNDPVATYPWKDNPDAPGIIGYADLLFHLLLWGGAAPQLIQNLVDAFLSGIYIVLLMPLNEAIEWIVNLIPFVLGNVGPLLEGWTEGQIFIVRLLGAIASGAAGEVIGGKSGAILSAILGFIIGG